MKVLYIGDGPSDGAARYLISVMKKSKIDYTHFPPSQVRNAPSDSKELAKYDVIILSDVPSKNLGKERMESIKGFVKNGGGLAMIGGWESFTGINGKYRNTPIEEVLPVRCLSTDDRINNSNGFKIIKKCEHPILAGLPWNRSPTICGFNKIVPKKDSKILLTAKEIIPIGKSYVESVKLSNEEHPLLVAGSYDDGKTLALATDAAPHWVGSLVDWGRKRVKIGNSEVGDLYIKFLKNMLYWLK
jgi:uncharacterized membrane protein